MMPQATEVLSFRIGDQLCALRLERVIEVLHSQRLTRVPRTPRHIAGLTNLRGRVLPVLNGNELFRFSAEPTSVGDMVVCDTSCGLVCLQVDAVMDVVHFGEPEPPPSNLSGECSQYVSGVLRWEETLLLLLEPERLLKASLPNPLNQGMNHA